MTDLACTATKQGMLTNSTREIPGGYKVTVLSLGNPQKLSGSITANEPNQPETGAAFDTGRKNNPLGQLGYDIAQQDQRTCATRQPKSAPAPH